MKMKRIAFLFGTGIVAVVGFGAFVAWSASEWKPVVGAERVAVHMSAMRKVDLNTATIQELERLPGIGPELAERVVQHRPYHKLDELISRKVLGRKQFARIKEHVYVTSVSERSTAQ